MKVLPYHFVQNNHISHAAVAAHNTQDILHNQFIFESTDQYLTQLLEKYETVIEYSHENEFSTGIQPLRYLLYLDQFEAYISYSYQQSSANSDISSSVYFKDRQKVEPLLEFIRSFKRAKVVTENYISLITQKNNSLSLHSFQIKMNHIDIGMNYGEVFKPKYDKIMSSLGQQEGKGIVLLHGNPGTGKTSLIKHIAKNLTKKIIFVPPMLAGALCSPEFISFMMSYPNSVLIIEDAENVISSREIAGTNQSGVSNILNISDGILGDCLNIQIVASFNVERSKIDEALLRKGRLIVEHEFGPLSVEESNTLLEHLDKTFRTERRMTLTEIYNIDETEMKSKSTKKAMGFSLT